MENRLLVISVHPDDETLGVGGTILKNIEKGSEVYWLNITDGNTDQRMAIPLISNAYKFKETINLKLPELILDDLSYNDIIPNLSNAINEIEPSTIFIPNRSDIHSDHRKAFKAIMSCTKSFRYPFIKKILMYETISETDFSPALVENVFIPNCFVDITHYMAMKKKILKIYKSEIMKSPYTRSIGSIEALARYRGSRIGVQYAEGFMLLLEIE